MIGTCSSRFYLQMRGWMLLALFALAGCSPKPHADIEGKVTLDGTPVPSCFVNFTSDDGSAAFSIRTWPDGTYKGIDVPLGSMKVCINRSLSKGKGRGKGGSQKPKKNEEKAVAGPTAPIPQKYSDPDSSGLTTTIKPGSNNYDIELSSH